MHFIAAHRKFISHSIFWHCPHIGTERHVVREAIRKLWALDIAPDTSTIAATSESLVFVFSAFSEQSCSLLSGTLQSNLFSTLSLVLLHFNNNNNNNKTSYNKNHIDDTRKQWRVKWRWFFSLLPQFAKWFNLAVAHWVTSNYFHNYSIFNGTIFCLVGRPLFVELASTVWLFVCPSKCPHYY